MADDDKAFDAELVVVDENGNGDKDDDKINKILMETLLDWKDETGEPVLQPAVVYSESPYAPYVEFGTSGSESGHAASDGPLYGKILDWVQKGPLHKTGVDAEKAAKAITRKIHREGINPYPFMRSAVAEVTDDLVDADISDYGSLYKVCEEIQTRAVNNLVTNSQQYTGALVDSIKVERIDDFTVNEETGEIEVTVAPDTDKLPWDDPEAGIQAKTGKIKRAKNYKRS
jgi:hypothetical protein